MSMQTAGARVIVLTTSLCAGLRRLGRLDLLAGFLLELSAKNPSAKLHATIANVNIRPSNQLSDFIMRLTAERTAHNIHFASEEFPERHNEGLTLKESCIKKTDILQDRVWAAEGI
jgi:hypothetical protein